MTCFSDPMGLLFQQKKFPGGRCGLIHLWAVHSTLILGINWNSLQHVLLCRSFNIMLEYIVKQVLVPKILSFI